jgi:hypothetical protein
LKRGGGSVCRMQQARRGMCFAASHSPPQHQAALAAQHLPPWSSHDVTDSARPPMLLLCTPTPGPARLPGGKLPRGARRRRADGGAADAGARRLWWAGALGPPYRRSSALPPDGICIQSGACDPSATSSPPAMTVTHPLHPLTRHLWPFLHPSPSLPLSALPLGGVRASPGWRPRGHDGRL